MAQNLLSTHPEALSIDEHGYYNVDYERLGIRMVTLEEWLEDNTSILLKQGKMRSSMQYRKRYTKRTK